MIYPSYAETVATTEAAERVKEDARQEKYRVGREKHKPILEASYNNIIELETAVEKLLWAEWVGELDPDDYQAFIEKHDHIYQAEHEKDARIRDAVKLAVEELREKHDTIQSKPWQIKKIEQLYTDFFKRLREHDCSDFLLNGAEYEVNRLKHKDAELIQNHKWRKAKELREQQAVAEKQRKASETDQMRADKIGKAVAVENEKVLQRMLKDVLASGVLRGK